MANDSRKQAKVEFDREWDEYIKNKDNVVYQRDGSNSSDKYDPKIKEKSLLRKLAYILFSPRGRIDRLAFWQFSLAALAIGSLLILVTFLPVNLSFDFLFFIVYTLFIPIYLLLLFCNVMVVIKRLHDINKSGWYYVPYVLVPAAFSGMSERVEASQGSMLLKLISIGIGLFALWELGFKIGTRGDNKYGVDPFS